MTNVNPPGSGVSVTQLQLPQLLGTSSGPAATTSTADTQLASIPVPASLMGLNGTLEVHALWSHSGVAGNWNPHVRFSGLAGTDYNGAVAQGSANVGQSMVITIGNKGATNSQKGGIAGGGTQATATALITSAVDTTVPQTVVISGQVTAGDTLTLESYTVLFFPQV